MSNEALRERMAQASYDAFAPYKPGANASQWLSVLRHS
jgi:hypothetical protein